MSKLLEARQLSVRIGRRNVCERLDLTLRSNQSWALLGRNGAGKTTLLHHLAGLRRGHSGDILLGDTPIADLAPRKRAQKIGVLLQHSGRGFGASVLETVLTGRHPYLATLAWEGPADLSIARECLVTLGLDDLAERALDSLSGGELRRVEIARLLAQRSPISMLDEPMNHLDLAHQATCLRSIRSQCVSEGHAMLLVVHDINLAYRACDNWLLLEGDGGWHAGHRDDLSDPKLLGRIYGHPISRIESDEGPLFMAQLLRPAPRR